MNEGMYAIPPWSVSAAQPMTDLARIRAETAQFHAQFGAPLQPGDQVADTNGLAACRDTLAATAAPLPGRALRPLARVGGLFCLF